ncbi:cobalamin biosynthesis protein CbiD [Beggiatoa sp. PS]|nr:cobalamin biosynthesis protein CbiD [Beggiatoa sp. PS]
MNSETVNETNNQKLRSGITTGTCAAAAAKAAALALYNRSPSVVDIKLPLGQILTIPLLYATSSSDKGYAAVRKEAGDDPDITDGATIAVEIAWVTDMKDLSGFKNLTGIGTGSFRDDYISFHAGEGVGIVTKPGLQIPPGEPAINPVPRQMIHQAIRSVTDKPVKVTISVSNGRELAKKTFNPRLGIKGGISILGTTGIVKPYSRQAILHSLKCALDIAAALDIRFPVLVPGNIGRKAALAHFVLPEEQVIDVGNDWGYMLDYANHLNFEAILALGHPGKLAKLANRDWNTHSSHSKRALPYVIHKATTLFNTEFPTDTPTVDGFFKTLSIAKQQQLGNAIATAVEQAILEKLARRIRVGVVLVNMQGGLLGEAGDTKLLSRKSSPNGDHCYT